MTRFVSYHLLHSSLFTDNSAVPRTRQGIGKVTWRYGEPWSIPWNNLWLCVLSNFVVFIWMSAVDWNGFHFCCCFGKGNMWHGARFGEGGECLERWYLLLSPKLADWNRFIHRRFVVAQKPTAILCICLETCLMPKLRFVHTRVLIFYTFPSVFIVTWRSDFSSSSTFSLPIQNLSAHSNTRAIDRSPSPYVLRNKCKYPVAVAFSFLAILMMFSQTFFLKQDGGKTKTPVYKNNYFTWHYANVTEHLMFIGPCIILTVE